MAQITSSIINPNDTNPIWFSVPGHKTPTLISWKKWGNYLMESSGIPVELWIIILAMKFKMEKWDMIMYMEKLDLELVKKYCFNGQLAYTMQPRRSYLYEHIPAQFRYDIDILRDGRNTWQHYPEEEYCCKHLSEHKGLLCVASEMLKLEKVMKKWGSMFGLITREFISRIREKEDYREEMGQDRHIAEKHWEFSGNWWFHVKIMDERLGEPHDFFKECMNLYNIWRCHIWNDVNSMVLQNLTDVWPMARQMKKCCKKQLTDLNKKNQHMEYFFEQYLVCGSCAMCRHFEHYFFQNYSWNPKDESVCGNKHEFDEAGKLIPYEGYKAPVW